jgi:hypothetical protein
MKFAVLALTITVMLGAVSFRSQARQNPPSNPQAPEITESAPIRAEVTRVNMLFSVTDKHGRFVTDLNKSRPGKRK